MRCLQYIRLLGFLFIIAATFIITVVIPPIDRKTENILNEIEIFNSGRVFAGIIVLRINHLETRKQLDLFQSNLIKDQRLKKSYLQKALNRTVTEIKHWANFYIAGDKSIPKNIETELSKIVDDKSTDMDTKFTEVENLLGIAQQDAFERLRKAHEERDEKKSNLNKFNENLSIWNSIFVWFQIIGLILFTGSETIEKFINARRVRDRA